MSNKKSSTLQIKAKSHLIHLLGDELIGDDGLAVFELVKNGYDADASFVNVTLDLNSDNPYIKIEDDGHGMSISDIEHKWLELGTGDKRGEARKRSKKFKRLPLGEKGVGRLASAKLGDRISIISKRKNHREVDLTIDWPALINSQSYISDLAVEANVSSTPNRFANGKSGTSITIRNLRRKEWSRRDIRKIYRLISSLVSPFSTPDKFQTNFKCPGREHEFSDMLSADEFLQSAVWVYKFKIDRSESSEFATFSWSYSFSPPNWKGLPPREDGDDKDTLAMPQKNSSRKKILVSNSDLRGIGPIEGIIYAYYRRPEVLQTSNNQTQLSLWLDDQTGVRVYRDGVRVFNYGEKGDDWLELNSKRVNRPAGQFGTNSLVSAIHIHYPESYSLKEKTNREGFESGETYECFSSIVGAAFNHFGNESSEDRKKIDRVIKGRDPDIGNTREAFSEKISRLHSELKNHQSYPSIKRDLDSISEDYENVREVMASAGMAGLNLSVIFHEVERGIDLLSASIIRENDHKKLLSQIEHIQSVLHTFSPLLKKNPPKTVFASEIIRKAIAMREIRLEIHEIAISAPVLAGDEQDFTIHAPPNLIIGALCNLIDNSIYWNEVQKERNNENKKSGIKISCIPSESGKSGTIYVSDTGTGFTIDIDKATQPFYGSRPEGMGLGLFFSSLVMEQNGGALSLLSIEDARDELFLPEAYCGATVALRFKE